MSLHIFLNEGYLTVIVENFRNYTDFEIKHFSFILFFVEARSQNDNSNLSFDMFQEMFVHPAHGRHISTAAVKGQVMLYDDFTTISFLV